MAEHRDIAAEITAEILERLEEGVMPWRCTWRKSEAGLPRRHSGTCYRGINHLFLGLQAHARGYSSSYWMTFNKAKALGGSVRKGETASVSVFYGTGQRRDKEAEDDDDPATYRFLRYNSVFNADQIDGLPSSFYVDDDVLDAGGRPIASLETFFDRMGLPVTVGGDMAAYRPGLDDIVMPPHERFEDPEKWYATLAHEGAHYSGGPSRLDRQTLVRYHDSRSIRAEEELVAELAAAMIGAHLGLSPHHIDSHASYVANWITALKSDKRLFLKAAAAAQEAVDWMFKAAGVAEGEDPLGAAASATAA